MWGISFPSPGGDPAPWYTRPGFIAGIPAGPWFMPRLLGVLLLRRAGADAFRPATRAVDTAKRLGRCRGVRSTRPDE